MSGHSSNAPQAGDIQEQPAPRRIRSEIRRPEPEARPERQASEESHGPTKSTQISRLVDAYEARLKEQVEATRKQEAENARLKRRLKRMETELHHGAKRRPYRTPSPQASKSRSRERSPRRGSQRNEKHESDNELLEQPRPARCYRSPTRADEDIRNCPERWIST